MTSDSAIVFVIDDDHAVRKGLERLLRSAGLPVETFGSAIEFLDRADYQGVGCITLDLAMPDVDGLELQQRLGATGSGMPIIFLSGHGDIPMSVQAMKGGAVDFLTKPADEQTFLEAVDDALVRHRRFLSEYCGRVAVQKRIASLSPRELDVLRCVLSGALNKQIALHLGIAEKTVKVHRARVMQKMGVASVAELVRLCDLVAMAPQEGLR